MLKGDEMSAYFAWGFFATFVIVGALDIALALKNGGQLTITAYIRTMSHQYPILPFLAGVLGGHLFWGG
jgi:hypothetical protein